MLWTRLVQAGAGQEKHRAADERRLALDLGYKGLDVKIRIGTVTSIEEAVKHEKRGVVPIRLPSKQLDDCVKAALTERLKDTHIGDVPA
jgi:hypothetical protein